MIKLRRTVVAVVALFVSCLSLSDALAKDVPARSGAGSGTVRNDTVKVVNASRVMREITALPKRKIPPVLLKEAAAVVIIPKAYKQAFMVKGGNSGGVLLVRDKAGTWSSPVFVTISGGTLGWQIVGDPMDVVLLFRTSKQVDSILKGKFALDTKISIVPGRVAPTMKGASKEELTAEVTSYVLSHGAFVEDAVVAGTTLQADAAANDAYYGKAKIYAGDILSGSVATPGEEFTSLQKLLDDYAADR